MIVDEKAGLVSAGDVGLDYDGYQVPRRTIYLPVIRNATYEMLAMFDVADANAVTSVRNDTTVVTQSMFMLNNHFVRDQDLHLTKRLFPEEGSVPKSDKEDAQKFADNMPLEQAYLAILGRPPTDLEVRSAVEYLQAYITETSAGQKDHVPNKIAAWQSYCQLLFCLNEFLYVD